MDDYRTTQKKNTLYNNNIFVLYNNINHIIISYIIIIAIIIVYVVLFYQKTGSVVQQTPETDGETPLHQTAVIRVQSLVQRDGRRRRPRLRGYGRVPHELSLQLFSVLGMH